MSINPWRAFKGIPKNIWLLSAATLINRMGTMLMPFLALYLTSDIGITPAKAGLVLAAYGLGALLSNPFAGKLSDKLGPLKLMTLSLIISGIFLLFYPFIDSFIWVMVLSFIWAIITEAYRPAGMAFVSDQVHPDKRKTAFALYRLAANLGMSIGPVLGGLLSAIDFSLLFYVDGITSIIAGLFLIFNKWDDNKYSELDEETSHEEKAHAKLGILKDFRFIYFLLALIPVEIVMFQHIGAMPIFLVKELGYPNEAFGLFIAINTVLIILFEVPLNDAMSNWKHKNSLSLGALLFGVGFGALAFASTFIEVALTILIWTIGEMMFFPAASAYAAEISPKEKRGEYMGYLQMTFSFSFMIGPWLGTFAFDEFGSFALWGGTLIFGIASAFMMLYCKGKE